jgi:hypothetical protein
MQANNINDELRLASLILLLRQPLDRVHDEDPALLISSSAIVDYDRTGTPSSPSSVTPPPPTTTTTTLRDALEKNDCDLLHFLARLVRHYEKTTSSKSSSSFRDENETVEYAYLRLAARVVFFRYATPPPPTTPPRPPSRIRDGEWEDVREREMDLLHSLLAAVRVRSRRDVDIDEVDVEIAWAIVGLCVELGTNDDYDDEDRDDLETDSIDALVERRRRRRPPRWSNVGADPAGWGGSG